MAKQHIKSKLPKNINHYNNQIAWAIAIFSFILYANTIANGYNLDDELVSRNNSLTSKGISGLIDIFTKPYFSDASGNEYEYRPMVLASFAIEHQFFGESPGVSHFINALLFSLLIYILFKLLRSLFENYNLLLPVAATLLFAAHPIHTEVVASIKNRDEILAFLFSILAVQMAIKYIISNKYSFLLLTLLMFLLGLLSKKSMMPFALVIPLALIMFKQPKLSQIVYLIVPLSIISSATSYFFSINTRFLFSISIISATIFFYVLNKIKSYNHFKDLLTDYIFKNFTNPFKERNNAEIPNNQIDLKYFFFSIMIISIVFCLFGEINTSKYILSIILIINILIYLFSISKQKEIILITITLPAILLFTQFNIASGMLLVFAYFLKSFDYKKRIHLLCLVFFIIPFIFNFELKYIFLFLLVSIIVFSFQIKKSPFIPLSLSILLSIVYLIMRVFIYKNGTDALFISFTFIIIGIGLFQNKTNYTQIKTAIFFIIPFVLLSEVIVVKSYSLPMIVQSKILNKATVIMPASGRSLDFAEMPINKLSSLGIRTGTAFVTMAFYLKLLILPHPLGFYYGYDMIPIVSIANHWAIVSLMLHLFLFLLALFWFKKHKIISFAILYYLICISIFSNIIAPVAGLIGERLVFTASLGFCIAIAYIILKISKLKTDANLTNIKINQKFLWVFIVLISLYSFKTFSRNTQWKNHLSLFENDMVYLNRSAQANNMYASALIDYLQKEKNAQKRNQMFDKAIEHFEKAVNIYPDFYNASYNLGKAYYFTKRYDEAISTFEQTLKIDSTEYMIYMYLGIVYDEKNNYEKAKLYYQKTIEKAPDFIDAYTNLSALYVKLNDTQKAIETNLDLLKMKPDAYEPTLNIGKIYFAAHNLPAALDYFEKAYALNKTDKNLVNALYEINKSMGNTEKADYYMNLLRKPG